MPFISVNSSNSKSDSFIAGKDLTSCLVGHSTAQSDCQADSCCMHLGLPTILEPQKQTSQGMGYQV